jgi:UDP-GlcNAc:undecaprenyl-phosphate GlcNAc-1-phosphate transferase
MTLNPLFAFAMAAAGSAALCAALCRWSIPLKLVAAPRADRWHTGFTPNSGGIAIAAASLPILLVVRGPYGPIAVCAAVMAVFGFIDDRIQLRPLPKFVGQLLAAAMVTFAGCHISLSHSWLLNSVVTILWIVGVSNAFNLIDNMDGLSAGTAIIASVPILAIALWRHDAPTMLFAAVLGGALLGFMTFNFHPARIFMGDCGSLFIGFSVACASLTVSSAHVTVPLEQLWIPVLMVLYPIFDVLLVSVARTRAGRSITVGGRDHSSHRLVRLGLSQRWAAALLWMISAVGVCAALFAYRAPAEGGALSIVIVLGLLAFGIFLLSIPVYATPDVHHTRPSARIPAPEMLRSSQPFQSPQDA